MAACTTELGVGGRKVAEPLAKMEDFRDKFRPGTVLRFIRARECTDVPLNNGG